MSSIRIKGLGGFDEIGGSSAQIEFLGNIKQNLLIDSGIRMINQRGLRGGFRGRSEGHVSPDARIDAVAITHGHSDHHGNLPKIWQKILDGNSEAKVYMTTPTFDTAVNLWVNTSFLLNKKKVTWGRNEHEHMEQESLFNKGMRLVSSRALDNLVEKPGWVEIFPGVGAYFGPNGHIRGSAFIVLRMDIGGGKHIQVMFSGDMSVYDSPTVKGMKLPEEFIGKLDAMFVEATYGDRVLIPRNEEEDRMAYLAQESIGKEGIALAPAFGVGRCPDAAIAQWLRGIKPLYLDGMGRQFLDLCVSNRGYWCELDHISGFDPATSDIKYVEDRKERQELIYESGGFSVVCTAGMMVEGSCAWQYAVENNFLGNSHNTVLQTGYQAEATEGWELQEAVKRNYPFFIDGRNVEVRAQVPEQLQLSSHADGLQIASIVNALRPKKVFINHGNDNGREGLKNNLLKVGFGGEIHLPGNGKIIEI